MKSLGLFGSYVRGQQQANSDLDILVNFDELPSLIKFIHFEDRLSELTGLEIDLVMEDGLKPNIGKQVLREVVRLRAIPFTLDPSDYLQNRPPSP